MFAHNIEGAEFDFRVRGRECILLRNPIPKQNGHPVSPGIHVWSKTGQHMILMKCIDLYNPIHTNFKLYFNLSK